MSTLAAPLAERIVDAFQTLLGGGAGLHEPCFAGNEWDYVKDCIDAGWVSTAGSYVGRFEDMLADFTGAENVIATSSGTAALHAVFAALEIGAGDEVIVPALTFAATANAVTYTGAVPHFADIETTSLGLDAAKLRQRLEAVAERRHGVLVNTDTGRRIAAVCCMHTFGHPCDLDALAAVCADFGIDLIEDAAESLGSWYKDTHTGNAGRVATLSFNGNKTVTTGGGGAIMCNDGELALQIRHLTTTAKQPHKWEFIHDRVGFNYRLPNINAALGCAQLESLPAYLEKKRRLAEAYFAAFADVPGIRPFKEPAWGQSNYWLNLIMLDDADAVARDEILEATNDAGFMTRAAWRPMHLLAPFVDMPRDDLSVTEDVYARLINIPSSSQLADRLKGGFADA
ncbi:MAG: LegC family aminotransferase [Rhodospirillales bacterium]